MHRPVQGRRFAGHLVLATLCIAFTARPSAQGPLRPLPEALAAAPAELVDRLRADPFTYFRFINRPWTARVCEVFADVTDPTIVRLHGDAHVEQYAFTNGAWGLDDFDDSSRGPAFVDIMRFLGSIDLATRQRGWTRDREALWKRFFEGYYRGLSEPDYRPSEPDLVRQLRKQAPLTRAAYLAWGEQQMRPMEEAQLKSLVTGMETLERLVRVERSDLAPGYFAFVRAGWLRIGVGSATARKALIRLQGPTGAPEDDVLIEAKEVANLTGLTCLEKSTTLRAARVIDGTRQIGRLKHDILAIGPMEVPTATGPTEYRLDWWVSSWEPSYREVRLTDLRSVKDLAAIVYDSGVQLGANKLPSVRQKALSSSRALESRLKRETARIVEELLVGWRELSAQ
jgi:uncharacterized protein (DUF2252 family)